MRSRFEDTGQGISLFPFLSVLVCLIGVLMFLAAAVAPTSLQEASENVEIIIETTSTEHGMTPILLECVAGRAVSLDGRLSFSEDDETEGWSEDGDSPFTRFLRNLTGRSSTEYLLFVVRPDGLEVHRRLKSIVMACNAARRERSVSVSEEPEEIPSRWAGQGARYERGSLYFVGEMPADARAELQAQFDTEAGRRAVDELFALCADAPGPIHYGSELMPAEWEVKGSQFQQASPGGGAP